MKIRNYLITVIQDIYFLFFLRNVSELESAILTALDIDPEPEAEPVAPASQSQPEPCSDTSPSLPVFGPLTFSDEYITRVNTGIEGLMVCEDNMQKYLELLNKDRFVVEVDKIVELFEGQCSKVGCSSLRKVVDKKVAAGVLLITHKCSHLWNLIEKRGQKMYVSTVLLASSVLVSGNNFEKVALLAKSMNLNYVSSTTFPRIQSLYAFPGIKDLWGKMKEVIWKVFENDILVVCGDGRMDSPGFSAKYCVYTMMEHYLNVIVDLEVVDKWEAGGTSTLMEKMGCKWFLERMMHRLDLGELVTDASRVIMKMVRELKGMTRQLLLVSLLPVK